MNPKQIGCHLPPAIQDRLKAGEVEANRRRQEDSQERATRFSGLARKILDEVPADLRDYLQVLRERHEEYPWYTATIQLPQCREVKLGYYHNSTVWTRIGFKGGMWAVVPYPGAPKSAWLEYGDLNEALWVSATLATVRELSWWERALRLWRRTWARLRRKSKG